MNEILESLSIILLGNVWIAPVAALFAGVLTSFTPCALSSVPLIMGYVGGINEENPKRSLALSLVFVLGNAITFTTLGIIASIAGGLIGTSSKFWYIALGTLMMLMTLQIWGIYEIIPSTYLVSKNTKRGFLGAFITGILSGIFSSPCSTPVLIALLTVVATSENLAFGMLLLLLYSIGHGVLTVIAGTSVGFVQKIKRNEKYGKLSQLLNVILGAMMMSIGFYMFYLAF